jgi:hypothetical protein
MTIDEVKKIFEGQLGKGSFPEYDDERAYPTANDLYQFAHAIIREQLAQQLENAYGRTNT